MSELVISALAAQGITHDEIREIEVRMEEAFISLIHRQAESAQEFAAQAQGPESVSGNLSP